MRIGLLILRRRFWIGGLGLFVGSLRLDLVLPIFAFRVGRVFFVVLGFFRLVLVVGKRFLGLGIRIVEGFGLVLGFFAGFLAVLVGFRRDFVVKSRCFLGKKEDY